MNALIIVVGEIYSHIQIVSSRITLVLQDWACQILFNLYTHMELY